MPRGRRQKRLLGLGQVTQVVAVTHGQETLDVATFLFSQLLQLVDHTQDTTPFKSELWEQPEMMK